MLLLDIALGGLALGMWSICMVGPGLAMAARRRISIAGTAIWLSAAALAWSWTLSSVRLADQTDGHSEPMTDWSIWVAFALAVTAALSAFLPHRTRRAGWRVHLF